MRARPNLSGDEQVQAYLNRVAAAARHLPKGARIAFVGRTKAQIDREIGAEGTADPGRVAEILVALGDPEELVRAERLRIDSKWLKNRGRDGDSAVVPGNAPRVYRPLRSRWKPAAPATRPLPHDADTGPDDAQGHTAPREPGAVPPPWPGDLDAMMPPSQVADEGRRPASGGPTPLDAAWQLARAHKLESIAIVVLGLGGLILPFPCWPVGALAATFSRRLFDGRDKVIAWLGPPLFAMVGSVVTAVYVGGKANPVLIYTRALGSDFGLLVRFGCVLSAVYLAWRVRKGRREKIPPWKR